MNDDTSIEKKFKRNCSQSESEILNYVDYAVQLALVSQIYKAEGSKNAMGDKRVLHICITFVRLHAKSATGKNTKMAFLPHYILYINRR